MTDPIDAHTLKSSLSDDSEIALLDVSEHGQHGNAHPFFAAPLPYSRFEIGLPGLAPNPALRVVLIDEGDGVAVRAAARAEAMGYQSLHVLTGGKDAWRRAGYTLYAGINVPSKAFGELVERERHTPRISAQAVQAMCAAKENLVIVDGRPFPEYAKMHIPGGICCPNGELVLRIKGIAPDPNTKIVVNCAGRTRSIIGAQTLLDFGIANPVYALENGTQGWVLAGLPLEHGALRRYPDGVATADISNLQAQARAFARSRGVRYLAAADAHAWLSDRTRTTYLFDVRSPEEYEARHVSGFRNAPGGQLIQALDYWVGVRRARIVLVDSEMVRAPVVAAWLYQLGYEACVLDGGIAAAAAFDWARTLRLPDLSDVATISAAELARIVDSDSVQVIDLRPSMTFRKGHIASATWSIRPRVLAAANRSAEIIVLAADETDVAALAAIDLAEAGFKDIRLLTGMIDDWRDAGLPIATTPGYPADADCIDFLFFVHDRHEGNAEAARQYLAWEIGLPEQLDGDERATFRLAGL